MGGCYSTRTELVADAYNLPSGISTPHKGSPLPLRKTPDAVEKISDEDVFQLFSLLPLPSGTASSLVIACVFVCGCILAYPECFTFSDCGLGAWTSFMVSFLPIREYSGMHLQWGSKTYLEMLIDDDVFDVSTLEMLVDVDVKQMGLVAWVLLPTVVFS